MSYHQSIRVNETKRRQRAQLKYMRSAISSYCICVLSEDERAISHLSKKINEKYLWTTGQKSIRDHIEMCTS